MKDDRRIDIDPFLHSQKAQLARKTARLAIFEAGALIREKFQSRGPLAVESKGAFDFVTEVDRSCEDLILNRIRKTFPDHSLMSEERPVENHSPSYVWIVDPLDGTTNFIHGFPMIAVSIALAVRGSVVMGWVYDPLRCELFEASGAQGLYATVSFCPRFAKAPWNKLFSPPVSRFGPRTSWTPTSTYLRKSSSR